MTVTTLTRRARDERGFTLLELLVASTIAAIGFLGLAATHTTAIRATAVGRNTSVATSLASQQLELMRNTPYANLATVNPTTKTVGVNNYTVRADVAGAPGGTAKRVTSRVNWSDQFGPHQVQLLTVMSP